MSVLTFISALVAHLAWPAFASLVFWGLKNQIRDLVGRIKSFKYSRGALEANLVDAGEHAAEAGALAVNNYAPEDDNMEQLRESIERVMISSAEWGFALGKLDQVEEMPELDVSWDEDSRPRITATGPAMRGYFAHLLEQRGLSRNDARWFSRNGDYSLVITKGPKDGSDKFDRIMPLRNSKKGPSNGDQ